MKNWRMDDFVAGVLDQRTRNFQLMGMDQQGDIVMLICIQIELDGWLEVWPTLKNGKKTKLVMEAWRKHRHKV
jgi:hypothetical protein